MSKEGMPAKVFDAWKKGDAAALRQMASKGGEHAAILRAIKTEKSEEEHAERRKLYTLTSDRSDGDVLPPEPTADEAIIAGPDGEITSVPVDDD